MAILTRGWCSCWWPRRGGDSTRAISRRGGGPRTRGRCRARRPSNGSIDDLAGAAPTPLPGRRFWSGARTPRDQGSRWLGWRHRGRHRFCDLLEESLVLGTKARQALVADAVGEAHAPAAPRRDPAEQGVPTVTWMPRASTDQHGQIPLPRTACRRGCKPCAPGVPLGDKNLSPGPAPGAQQIPLRLWKSLRARGAACDGHN